MGHLKSFVEEPHDQTLAGPVMGIVYGTGSPDPPGPKDDPFPPQEPDDPPGGG